MLARVSTWFSLLVLVVVMAPSQGLASGSEEEKLKAYVKENTLMLVERLEGIRDVYEQDRETFYDEMNQALSEFVAFRRIAARVMGQYARQASPEQRDQFVKAFRRSLYDAYGGAIVETGDFELKVEGVRINPRDENRATVNLRVITGAGGRYGVAYSMYRPDSDANWQMENVIVEGINIGLAFRDRFNQEMEEHRGDLQKVIDNWSADVAAIDGLEDAVEEGGDD